MRSIAITADRCRRSIHKHTWSKWKHVRLGTAIGNQHLPFAAGLRYAGICALARMTFAVFSAGLLIWSNTLLWKHILASSHGWPQQNAPQSFVQTVSHAIGAVPRPQPSTAQDITQAWQLDLHDKFHIPWELTEVLNSDQGHLLKKRLDWRWREDCQRAHSILRASGGQPPRSGGPSQLGLSGEACMKRLPHPRIFVAHVMHGLGNRLRAMTSAMAFASATNRELVVIWERDKHCAAQFSDLFLDALSNGSQGRDVGLVVVDEFNLVWSHVASRTRQDVIWDDWIMYNYMQRDGRDVEKGAPIRDMVDKHVYFKSAYVIQPEKQGLTGWDRENEALRQLKPVPSVEVILSRTLGELQQGMHPIVGVHIRSMSVDAEGINAIEEYGTNDTEVLRYWRRLSRQDVFFNEMKNMIKQDQYSNVRFFVASDSAAVVEEAKRRFGVRVVSTKSSKCDDRTANCLQIALADMILLSRSSLLLGSPWSSFTEGARRYGAKRTRLAGIDFGTRTSADVDSLVTPAVEENLQRMATKHQQKQPREGS